MRCLTDQYAVNIMQKIREGIRICDMKGITGCRRCRMKSEGTCEGGFKRLVLEHPACTGKLFKFEGKQVDEKDIQNNDILYYNVSLKGSFVSLSKTSL